MRIRRQRLGAALAALTIATGAAWGQATNTNAVPPLVLPPLALPLPVALEVGEAEEAARLPVPKLVPLEAPVRFPDAGERLGGLIGDATRLDQPWQLLNPLAPAAYGDGTRNLSVHPTTGRVEGVTLFSFRLFKSKPEGKQRRPAKPQWEEVR